MVGREHHCYAVKLGFLCFFYVKRILLFNSIIYDYDHEQIVAYLNYK